MTKIAIVKVVGMHCNSCKMLIEDVCQSMKGVESCSVDLESGKMAIEYSEGFDPELLKKEIEALGQYKVEINPLEK